MSSLSLKKFAMLFGNLTLHIAGYLGINAYLTRQGAAHDLAISLDYQIPFIKYFAPFYSIVYFIPVATFFLCWKDYETIKAAAKAFAGAGVVCFACFLLYPVKYTLRVELHPPYDFFTNILRFFYWIDQPFNCFPSLHVALAVISALAVRRCRPRLAPLFYLLAGIVSVSILFMKQHYVLDLVGGLALSWLMAVMFLTRGSETGAEALEPAAPA
ncbi:MAG: phosphatase PAP2 family protein [bacterium]